MRHERHPCGCVSERGSGRERWTALCAGHQAEFDARHAEHLQQMAERRAREERVQP